MNLLAAANTAGMDVLAVLDPGEGVAPPGSEGLVTIVNWVAWVAVALCVVGVIIAGVGMLFAGRRGDGGQEAAKLGWVMAGSIVIGGAAGLVGAVV